jgi:hypothetical protein
VASGESLFAREEGESLFPLGRGKYFPVAAVEAVDTQTANSSPVRPNCAEPLKFSYIVPFRSVMRLVFGMPWHHKCTCIRWVLRVHCGQDLWCAPHLLLGSRQILFWDITHENCTWVHVSFSTETREGHVPRTCSARWCTRVLPELEIFRRVPFHDCRTSNNKAVNKSRQAAESFRTGAMVFRPP